MGKRGPLLSPRKARLLLAKLQQKARPGLDLKSPPRTVRPLAKAKHWRKVKLVLQQRKVRQTELVRLLRMGKPELDGRLLLRTERPLAMAKRLRKVRLELDLKLQPRMEIPQAKV
jgi:hypothetical protein